MQLFYSCLFLLTTVLIACTSPNKMQGSSQVQAAKIIEQLKQGESVSFKDKIIVGDLNFTAAGSSEMEGIDIFRTYLNGSVTFINCKFQGNVIAYQKDEAGRIEVVRFERSVAFLNCQFEQYVNFRYVRVNGPFSFRECMFFQGATFEESQFSDIVNFNKSSFKREARFQNTWFQRQMNCMECGFEENMSFQGSEFQGQLQISSAQFLKYADFSLVNFRGDVFMSYANVADRMTLNQASCFGRMEFVKTEIMSLQAQKTRFWGPVIFNQSIISRKLDLRESAFFLQAAEKNDAKIAEAAEVWWE